MNKETKTYQIRVLPNTLDELRTASEVTGYPMTILVEIAWNEFTKTKKYADIMLFRENK